MNNKGHGKGSEATNNKGHFVTYSPYVSVSYDCTPFVRSTRHKYGSKIGQALARCSRVRLVLISVHNRINSKVALKLICLIIDS